MGNLASSLFPSDKEATATATAQEVADDIHVSYDNHVSYEIPVISSQKVPSKRLKRFSYSTTYNKVTRNPNWMDRALTAAHTDGEYARKNHSFAKVLSFSLAFILIFKEKNIFLAS